VGCGRCVRACPVGHSLLDYLIEIDRRAGEGQPVEESV
jgi:ferredoxin